MTAQPPASGITPQILSIVFYTFIAFLCIGLPIAVLPSYVHDQLGFGAPAGVLLVDELGFSVLGVALVVLAVMTLLVLRTRPDAVVLRGERLPFWSAFSRVAPFGLGLTLASIGYGTLTTFVTLYYLERGWVGAAWCLSAFGLCFIVSRLLFVNAVNRFGGYSVAMACMATEVVGLTLLWLAPSPAVALVGAGLTGFGLSLVYPALGVEAIKQVPSSSRGAGLGAYAVFFDLALAIAGPVMGAVAVRLGYTSIFSVAALLALAGVGLVLLLARRGQGR